MTKWTCKKHKIGNPKCKDCWNQLLRSADQMNVRIVDDVEVRKLHNEAYGAFTDKDLKKIPKDLFKK